MTNAIIIHGMPSEEEYKNSDIEPSNSHWIPWIKEKLRENNVEAFTPDMPKPHEPEYSSWKEVFEQYEIRDETILIGHSCGAGFLIRWLSEHDTVVGNVILVAPWLDPGKELKTGMFDFLIDADIISKAKRICVFYSIDDEEEILNTVSIIREKIPRVEFREYNDKGHFTFEDMKTIEFPDLLEEALK